MPNHAGLTLREIRARLQLVSAEQQDRYERYGWDYTVATVVGTGCRGLDAPLQPLSVGPNGDTRSPACAASACRTCAGGGSSACPTASAV